MCTPISIFIYSDPIKLNVGTLSISVFANYQIWYSFFRHNFPIIFKNYELIFFNIQGQIIDGKPVLHFTLFQAYQSRN